MDLVRRLLRLVLKGQFDVTEHALLSMDDDGLVWNDLIACLAAGAVRRKWPRERKYEIEGHAINGAGMRVVARLVRTDWVRIITVYAIR